MVKNESDLHRRAKRRIASILQHSPLYDNVITDDDSNIPVFKKQVISEFLEAKDYWPDIFAMRYFYYDSQRYSKDVIIEVDGSSHKSSTSTDKDNRRDKHFLSIKIPTVRFNIQNVIGKNSWTDDVILEMIQKEIDYQLK